MITQARLKELFHYDPSTGLFTRLVDVIGSRFKKGDIAGSTMPNEYTSIGIDRKLYPAHRLVWLYIHGEFPSADIDHINRVRDDNRLSNLRSVSRSENLKNKKIPDSNTSGVMGVHWHNRTRRWIARIGVSGKKKSLGTFLNKEDAVRARKHAEIKYGYHANHGKAL